MFVKSKIRRTSPSIIFSCITWVTVISIYNLVASPSWTCMCMVLYERSGGGRILDMRYSPMMCEMLGLQMYIKIELPRKNRLGLKFHFQCLFYINFTMKSMMNLSSQIWICRWDEALYSQERTHIRGEQSLQYVCHLFGRDDAIHDQRQCKFLFIFVIFYFVVIIKLTIIPLDVASTSKRRALVHNVS